MCGVCGIYNNDKAAEKLYLGLFALQHRGQDNAGMAVWDGRENRIVKDRGLVFDIFKPEVLASLPGTAGIGHTRYPTAGDSSVANAQPHYADTRDGRMVIVSNGDVTNMLEQTRFLKSRGFTPYGSNDAEVIVASIACYYEECGDVAGAIARMMGAVRGSYSAILLFRGAMYVFRDPLGIRPLAMGYINGGWAFASESCAIETMGGSFQREVDPGELVAIVDGKLCSTRLERRDGCRHCVFEHIYFSRPDSVIFGESVSKVRFRLGEELAAEHPVQADFVLPVPDSSNNAALGYAGAAGLPYKLALIRSHYIGRTFIGSTQAIRDFAVKLKFNPVRAHLDGRTAAVVDDSIVRGTTSKKIMRMLRDFGAAGLHLRISSPPIKFPCYYGVDTPRQQELIASYKSPAQIKDFVGVDSLGYLSLDGLKRCLARPGDYCYACLDGDYPIAPPAVK
ncbi:MAG: amidophosphoribosyltransferase [Candidatus Edwardsbacteria bacterium]|jgi:amidophosphoribosyltransferase|nr:amidophosphoribosyltransferase [Candidatus Edwardsbacteria bacterium]